MIRNWNEFDGKLKEIALIDIAVTEAGRARDLAMISAETRYKDSSATRLAARAALVKDMEKYYRANRKEAEAGGKRSKELYFGRAGIRATAAALKLAKGWKWPDVVGKINSLLRVARCFLDRPAEIEPDQMRELAAAFNPAQADDSRLWPWSDVIEELRAGILTWKDFVVVRESLAKTAVKAARLSDGQLATIGLRAKAGEEFFVETFPEKAAAEA